MPPNTGAPLQPAGRGRRRAARPAAPARSWCWYWQERGGPEVGPPTRRSFGTELIENGIAYGSAARQCPRVPPLGRTLRAALRARGLSAEAEVRQAGALAKGRWRQAIGTRRAEGRARRWCHAGHDRQKHQPPRSAAVPEPASAPVRKPVDAQRLGTARRARSRDVVDRNRPDQENSPVHDQHDRGIGEHGLRRQRLAAARRKAVLPVRRGSTPAMLAAA